MTVLTLADLAVTADDIDGRPATAVCMLAADLVDAAMSGHPRMPMLNADAGEDLLGWDVLSVEAGSRGGWVGLTGSSDRVVGPDELGTSGRAPAVLEHFGSTAKRVAEVALRGLGRLG